RRQSQIDGQRSIVLCKTRDLVLDPAGTRARFLLALGVTRPSRALECARDLGCDQRRVELDPRLQCERLGKLFLAPLSIPETRDVNYAEVAMQSCAHGFVASPFAELQSLFESRDGLLEPLRLEV